METSQAYLPEAAQDPISRFDYYSNRLKLDYLRLCFTQDLNPQVLAELKNYYGEEPRLAGGMNEAFRWFLGNPDVEWIEALPTGEPFIETLKQRAGSGLLFAGFDPRSEETCLKLQAACEEILQAYQAATSLEDRIMIMTEFFAVKVTCHDVFIHGRGEQPSPDYFRIPFVHIEPDREINYIQQVLESPPDDFRLKNILSYCMASGIDPVSTLSGTWHSKHRNRSKFASLVRELLEKSDRINARSFFRWDIYGICNFIEGPVFLRKDRSKRCVYTLEQSWENYPWEQDQTCTQASNHLATQAFSIVFDHSEVIQSGSPEYFSNPATREKILIIIQEAQKTLDRRFETNQLLPI